MRVVLDCPMHGIAGHSALAVERRNAAVFEATKTAFRSGPERTVRIESKPVDPSLTQSVAGSILCPDLTAGEISDTALEESQPQAILQGIGDHSRGISTRADFTPRNLSDDITWEQMKDTVTRADAGDSNP